jgi:hypothetical protein
LVREDTHRCRRDSSRQRQRQDRPSAVNLGTTISFAGRIAALKSVGGGGVPGHATRSPSLHRSRRYRQFF